jgi:glycosyltransferase involved in cell wall biosynthesis
MRTLDRWAVRRQIDQLDPDLVHVHGQAAAYPLAAFDTRRPTVVTIQGINTLEAQVDRRGGALLSRLRIALWGSAERRCLRRATDLVVQGPFVRQFVASHTNARLHLIENPVHDAFFRLDPEPEPGRVLLVGSIQKRKGTLEAIKAMAYVRQQVPHAYLILAGGVLTPFRQYGEMVRQVVVDSGADQYVHFMGHLGQRELLEAHRTSQIFLFPTYLEGSPMALAEAMTSGLPSVVSDIDSTVHLVEDGVTGYRVPVGDIQALAERITHLLLDEATRQRFGQRAREIATERFTQELAARKTRDLYLALVGDPARSALAP